MYDAQVAALKGRYRCIAYDHRGQGASAVAEGGYDIDNVAEDAARSSRARRRAVHFVGLSMAVSWG